MGDTDTKTDTKTAETGQITGAMDKDYNLLWYTETCLEHALRLERYCQDAERAGDTELVELFKKAQADSRKGAQLGMQMLADRLTGMAPPASSATTGAMSGGESMSGESMSDASGASGGESMSGGEESADQGSAESTSGQQ
jgi:hypothetical protein